MALANKKTPRKLLKGRTDGILDSEKITRASASMADDIFSQDPAYADGHITPILYHADLMQEDIDEIRRHITNDRTQTDNNFTTVEKNKLNGIESSADVTDATNVKSALNGMSLSDVGTPASSDRILLQDASGGGALKYATFDEFGGTSSSSPVFITSLGGRVQVTTSADASAQNIVLAGSLGAHYYAWGTNVFTGANGISSGLGTPNTSTFRSGTGYNINNGLFRVLSNGTANIAGTIEWDSNSEVVSQTMRIFVWKIGSDELRAMDNGSYDSAWGGTLVASTSITAPARYQNISPMRFKSTNGVSISEGDMIFATCVYDGTVTRTRYFFINYQLYTT